MREPEFTLGTIAGGAVEMRVAEEIEKVLRNIDDPNTDAQAKREITVRLTFKPSKTRSSAELAVLVTSKLQPHSALEIDTYVSLDRSQGRYRITEHNPLQRELPIGEGAGPSAAERKPS